MLHKLQKIGQIFEKGKDIIPSSFKGICDIDELKLDVKLKKGNVIIIDVEASTYVPETNTPLVKTTSSTEETSKKTRKKAQKEKHPKYTFTYKSCTQEEYDVSKNDQFLYHQPSGNGVSPFPTFKLDDTKNKNVIEKNIKKEGSKLHTCLSKIPDFESLPAVLFENQDKKNITFHAHILNDIAEKVVIGQENLISLRINNQYPKDCEILQEWIEYQRNNFYESFSSKYTVKSYHESSTCFFCNQHDKKVYGFGIPSKYLLGVGYTFYSNNEPAYIAGGFEKKQAWKNFPTCASCIRHMLIGQKFVETYLNDTFFGCSYLIVPDVSFINLEETNIENSVQALCKLANRNIPFHEQISKQKTSGKQQRLEDLICKILSEIDEQMSLDLFFYFANKGECKILHEMNSLFPSRFSQILAIQTKVNQKDMYHDHLELGPKGELGNATFSLHNIHKFFPAQKGKKNFKKEFLSIMSKVFEGKPISIHLVLQRVMQSVREHFFDKEKNHTITFFKGLVFVDFLFELNIAYPQPQLGVSMTTSKYEVFFQEQQHFFKNPAQKAVFLLGVIVKKLLNIQYQDRKSQPFRNRLNGLKIDGRIAKRIFVDCIEKLEQYNKHFYRDLQEAIADYFFQAGDTLYQLSVDEISFHFMMGMSLHKKVGVSKEEEDSSEGSSEDSDSVAVENTPSSQTNIDDVIEQDDKKNTSQMTLNF